MQNVVTRVRALMLAMVVSAVVHPLNAALADAGDTARAAQANSLLQNEQYQQASDYCLPWLAELVRQYSDQSIKLVPALNCLGKAQFELADYLEAATAFERSVVILEREKGVFAPELTGPLEGLGESLQRLNRLDEATSVLQKAKGISHRNLGIFNTEQRSIVDRLSTVYLLANESRKADNEQQFLLQAHEQKYGESPQLLGALRRYAQWQIDMGRMPVARQSYRRAIAIMERAYGKDDLRLVGPLRDYARSFSSVSRNARVMPRAGVNSLLRVVELYRAQESVDQADVTEAIAEVGDWFVMSGQRGKAHRAYQQAWANTPELAAEKFAEPSLVEFQDRAVLLGRRELGRFPAGVLEIEFRFDVDEFGRVQSVDVVRDESRSYRFALRAAEILKRARYRPRMVDGRPVRTEGLTKIMRYDFGTNKVIQQRSVNQTGEVESLSGEQENIGEPPAEEPTPIESETDNE